ncbi:hypothetical protein [Actinomadura rubrisoli]|uniref:hypothetical protein n=1 Tax=Actinomadura rubrisoli TaxID=2530368 RepID=UPI001A9CE717|nr:hypothetical protein [Actinomadura rubrisoli]
MAVALANASFLGVGYLMLRRRKLAVATGLVTLVLVTLLASVAQSVWFEVVVLLWWAALIAHGWLLAGERVPQAAMRRQRLIALSVTVPVLLVVGLLRFDASRIEGSVTEARQKGDCPRVSKAQDEVWLGHRVVAAPPTAHGDQTVRACKRLRTADSSLTTGLTGDAAALKAGFDTLASVLAEPGHKRMVEVTLNRFLGGLPGKNPCHTAAVTDWLRQRPASHNALDRSADVAARTAPAALVGCGDELMATEQQEGARTRYQQLLDQYPSDGLAAKARTGVREATLAIELANVRSLLEDSDGTQPEYCSSPAKYSGAAPYGKGTNRALFYGNDKYTNKLPARWRTTDPAKAVLVVCADDREYGARVQTCLYTNKYVRSPKPVTFRKIAIPVKVYELRTGKRVVDTKVQIDGTSCPSVLHYTAYVDRTPPSKVYVTASDADVRAAFSSLIIR